MATLSDDGDLLRPILDSMAEGVVAVDRDRRVVHLNEVAGRLLQTPPASSVGRRIDEVTRVREVVELVASALAGAAEATREVRLAEAAKDRVLEVRATPLRDRRGAPAGAVLVLLDVTELRRLEAVRRDFVANVSHELKTPVTAIRGLVETLLDDEAMDAATHRRFLEKIRNQSGRLSALVTDLLTLSRVESEAGTLEGEPLDLREPVRESAKALSPAGEAKGLALETHVPEGPVPIRGDRELLRQVVDNLLDNAIKYTPSRGRVQVRVRTEGGAALIEVEDTGIGIEPQHQDRIFERFYRVDKARSRELGGTGLGLSIVKHITLAHGGQVSIESAPGKGSTFRVRLPLAPAAA